MNRPTAVEIFCGVGGMSLGFEQASFDVAVAVDNDPINVEFHQKNFPACRTVEADIRTLTVKQLKEATGLGQYQIAVLFGGPPCQGFSLIGKRHVNDERNELVYQFAKWVTRLKPLYFVMENVPGLLLGRAKEVLEDFKRSVRRSGYFMVEPVATLDASNFGVPQKRLRAFVLGCRKDLPAPSYPKPNEPLKDRESLFPTVWDAIGDLPEVEDIDELYQNDLIASYSWKPCNWSPAMGPFLITCICRWAVGR